LRSLPRNQPQSQLSMMDVRMMIHLLILSMTLALNGMMPTQAPVVTMTARPLLPLTYVARVLELQSLRLQSQRIQLQLSMTDVRMMIPLPILMMILALSGTMLTQIPVETMTARPLLPLIYAALVLELGRLMSLSRSQLRNLPRSQPQSQSRSQLRNQLRNLPRSQPQSQLSMTVV